MRQYIMLVVISLSLIITVILAGIYFSPDLEVKKQALQLYQENDSSTSHGTRQYNYQKSFNKSVEHLILDSQFEAAILLEAMIPPTEQVDFALTTPAIENELSEFSDSSTQLICSEEAISLSPGRVPDSFQEVFGQVSHWKRLSGWVNALSLDHQYQVVLWHPAEQINEYILAESSPQYSLDDLVPVTVTCEDRT